MKNLSHTHKVPQMAFNTQFYFMQFNPIYLCDLSLQSIPLLFLSFLLSGTQQENDFKPRFPPHLILSEQAVFTLEVDVLGSQNISAQWYHNGRTIGEASLSHVIRATELSIGTYTILLHDGTLLLQTYSTVIGTCKDNVITCLYKRMLSGQKECIVAGTL